MSDTPSKSWEDVYRVQSKAIEKLTAERDALQKQLDHAYAYMSQTEAERYEWLCQAESERDALRDMIRTYCKETAWAAPSYKAQPHIKALFDAAKGGSDE